MEYGLRRYEAIQRLWWLVFFIICLVAANFSSSFTHTPRTNLQLKDLRNPDFWTGLQGIRMLPPPADPGVKSGSEPIDRTPFKKPGVAEKKTPAAGSPAEPDDAQRELQLLSRVLVYLIRAGIIFVELKLVWLLIQYAGRYLLQGMMSGIGTPGPVKPELARTNPELLFPRQALLDKIRKIPLYFLLHSFLRLRLMLSGFNRNVSSEELSEKERRIVETDWQILYSSWGPFRWLFWILPVLGLAQTAWLLIIQFHAASLSQKEILDTVQAMPSALLPLIQVAGLIVFLKVAAALLRRLEELYLSNLDAFIYDKLLSRLPLQSKDTVLILETLQHQFNELQAALKKLEEKISPRSKTEAKP